MIAPRKYPETLADVIRHFADKDAAFQTIVQLRWPSGEVTCPRCGGKAPNFIRTRYLWTCRECKRQFSAKIGTVLEDSPLGLDKWLPAIWLLANCKNGISSYELARALGVTQKTAWFMLGRIRLAMQAKSFQKMSGEVEVDESFIGGKRGNMHKSKQRRVAPTTGTVHMQAVMGMLQRKRWNKHSTVMLHHVRNTRMTELGPKIDAHIEAGANVYTDTHPSYSRLAKIKWGDKYAHAAVDHSISYVKGRVHTNGMENFWSLLKRAIKGTYVSVDPFHLFAIWTNKRSGSTSATRTTLAASLVCCAACSASD